MEKEKFRIGILGAGKICNKMAQTINKMEDCTLYAVAARDEQRAKAFAQEYNIQKAYGCYQDFLDDPKIDLVYIGTITSLHKEHMLMCLESGKNVLCEKSFTVNKKEAEEVFCKAKEKNLLAAEAIWTRYMPYRKELERIIGSGKIGRITSITANLAYKISDVPRIRLPEMGGGVMLDLSVYPINFALMALQNRKIKEYCGICVKNEEGADMKETLNFVTEDGVQASIFTDSFTNSDRRGIVYGEKGYIEIDNINDPSMLLLHSFESSDNPVETIRFSHAATGFEYQVEACLDALRAGKIEVEAMPWSETLRVMEIMDHFRSMFNVRLGSELN